MVKRNDMLVLGGLALAFLIFRGGACATGATGQRGGTGSIIDRIFGNGTTETFGEFGSEFIAGGPGDDADFAFVNDEDIGIQAKALPLKASQNVLTEDPKLPFVKMLPIEKPVLKDTAGIPIKINITAPQGLGQVPVLTTAQAATLSPGQAANIGILKAVTGTFKTGHDYPLLPPGKDFVVRNRTTGDVVSEIAPLVTGQYMIAAGVKNLDASTEGVAITYFTVGDRG